MQHWPLPGAYFWEKAPFFRLLIPFIAGIICYDQFNLFHSHYEIPYTTATVSAAIILLVPKKKAAISVSKAVNASAIFISLFFIAVTLSFLHDDRTKTNWFAHQVQTAENWKVKLIAPPQEKEKTWKLKVAVQHAMIGETFKAVTGRAFIYVYKDSSFALHENDLLVIPNHFQPIKNAGNPFEMDYAKFAARNNFHFQEFLSWNEIIPLPNATRPDWLSAIHQFSVAQLAAFIKDKSTLSLLQAMLAGEDNALDDDLRRAYAETGIIHIVSISGSHVALLFYIVATLFFWLRHKKYTALKYLLAIVPIWIYVLMAGGAPSAVRSAVMFSMLTIGVVLQRDHNPLNTLFAAAFILLTIKPTWLFSVGFQLSFLAVLSLIIFYGPVSRLFRPSNKIIKWLWDATAASIAAELLVAPLVLYYFHSFPAMFLLANIVASVCMSVLLIAGIVLVAFCWLTPVASCVAFCCTWITVMFNKIIFTLQAWSPASFNRFQLSAGEIILLYLLILCCSVWLLLQRRKMLFAALSCCCVLTIFLIVDKWACLHQRLLVVYNTGRSENAELISGNAYTTLLQTGKESFAVQNAHIGYHVTEKKTTTDDAFFLNNKKLLLLKAIPSRDEPFPADVLIIATPLKDLDFSKVRIIFKPTEIILSSAQPRYLSTKWKDSCAAHHISFYDPAEDGAFFTSKLNL